MTTRILMSDYSMKGLKEFIKYTMEVVVLPYSNYEYLKDDDNFYNLFDPDHGREFLDIAAGYIQYGIHPDNIVVINPHNDKEKDIRKAIERADIIFLSGGDPAMFMRYCPKYLQELIKNFNGIVMGSSAGAMVMQEWFYMYDGVDDFVGYSYIKGLGMAKGYNFMVHYVGSEAQIRGEENNIYTPIIRLPDGDNIVLV